MKNDEKIIRTYVALRSFLRSYRATGVCASDVVRPRPESETGRKDVSSSLHHHDCWAGNRVDVTA